MAQAERVGALKASPSSAPDTARFMACEDFLGYWRWAQDALPTSLVERVEGAGEFEGVSLADRCLVPPQGREESDEAFFKRLNDTLIANGLKPMAILDAGEPGFRIVALEGLILNAGLAEMIFWVRFVGRRQWLRFIVETHTKGAAHSACVALPLLEYKGRRWVGLVQENRFPLFADQDFMLGDWLESICRNGFLRAVPRAFALTNSEPSIIDRLLAQAPVKGLWREVSVVLAADVRSVIGRKVGSIFVEKEFPGLGKGPWFSIRDIVNIHRVAENSGRSNVVPEYFVARVDYDGPEHQFDEVIQKRFGPRGMRMSWHSLEPLLGSNGIEESRKVGLVDAHSEVALFALLRTLERLVHI